MNRRTFLMSSLAVIGTGLFLPKKVEALVNPCKEIKTSSWYAHRGRTWVALGWLHEQNKKGNILHWYIPRKYLLRVSLSDKYVCREYVPDTLILTDLKDGRKCVCSIYYSKKEYMNAVKIWENMPIDPIQDGDFS